MKMRWRRGRGRMMPADEGGVLMQQRLMAMYATDRATLCVSCQRPHLQVAFVVVLIVVLARFDPLQGARTGHGRGARHGDQATQKALRALFPDCHAPPLRHQRPIAPPACAPRLDEDSEQLSAAQLRQVSPEHPRQQRLSSGPILMALAAGSKELAWPSGKLRSSRIPLG